MITQKAQSRARILSFFKKHGLLATIDAFKVSRSTLYLWNKKLSQGEGKLHALNDQSRAPHERRKRIIDIRIENFIIKERSLHPRLGKDKLKPLLKRHCEELSVKTLSSSTIGRILLDLKAKGKIPQTTKLSFYAKKDKFHENPQSKRKKSRRKDFKVETPGDLLELDTCFKFVSGLKRYIIAAIDLKSDFAFAYCYPSLSSLKAKDFFNKLSLIAPFKITHIQTDNGLEFERYFHEDLEDLKINHFYTYPKCPKMNAHIERFIRTLKEEFLAYHTNILALDLTLFNHKLIDWLLWYNTERPHYALGQRPPMEAIVDQLKPEESRMTWTHTQPLTEVY